MKGKKTRKGRKFCSPHNRSKKGSCYTFKQLKKLSKHLKIKKKYKNKKALWNKINDSLKPKCDTEWCWNRYLDVTDKETNIFRPLYPTKWEKNPTEWLATDNLENVISQYEQKHSEFFFSGAIPIDFDLKSTNGGCIVDKLCKIDLVKLYKKGKTKLGIIFNLDPHDKPGSHWTALFLDKERNGIYYFDSYGMKPEKEINILMTKLKKQHDSIIKKPIKTDYNKIRHQYKDSECGTYCLYFIITMLTTNLKFKTFCNKTISDDEMLEKRKLYFIR
jgi:hypothetical protein